ncbi:uncharacterized protein BT62DRAFT_997335 [Guyanagaster necrorhizus]|uniref:Uncharacterized protein n=1 Tax=Guyanagaster necrorhizus TaxID=856835 RepID=A0A9P8AMC7_9AGAR|nr:uncharacterized protein BT62DRAFT_997335 [Guyanagaster necrorhizus MCA 3950]KAG7441123.1 hypothetical protein BT62DRAFT_997335 [Guyanagaster necrorhizus MCA 3950]
MSNFEATSDWKDTEYISDDSVSAVSPTHAGFSVASSSSEPMDRFTDLESIADQMRAFISNENRHSNASGCLEIACKDEKIEDAVYALGTIFYLNFSDPRGTRHARFTLPIDAPTIVDEDEVRHIIYGDLLHTPIRALAKKLRIWIADPNGPESVRVQRVSRIHELCQRFRVNVTEREDGVLLTKSKKFKWSTTVINEQDLEMVLREKRRKAVNKEKRLFLRTHRATAPTAQSVVEDPFANLHSITNELRSFVADIDGPRSMAIPKSAFSSEVFQLAAVFSLAITPESDAIVLTKKTQGLFVVSEADVADVLNSNGKRSRKEDDDDAETPPDSPPPSDGEDPGPSSRESQHQTRILEQEIREFVVDAQGLTSMTLYCLDNARKLSVFLLSHAFGLICSETPSSPYVRLTRTENTTSQNIDEVSVKRLLTESHPSFRAAQLILEGGPNYGRISDIQAFEQCLRAFIDDAEATAFSIPHTTDRRVVALANVFHLRIRTHKDGDRMILHKKIKGKYIVSKKKLDTVLAVPKRRRKKRRRRSTAAPSELPPSAEPFPDIEFSALSLY